MDMARVESVIKRYRSSEAGLISGAEVMVDANPYLGFEHDDLCHGDCSVIVAPRCPSAPMRGGRHGYRLSTWITSTREHPHRRIPVHRIAPSSI